MNTIKIYHSFPVGYLDYHSTNLTLENTNPIVVGMDGALFGVIGEGETNNMSPLAILFQRGVKALRREMGFAKSH